MSGLDDIPNEATRKATLDAAIIEAENNAVAKAAAHQASTDGHYLRSIQSWAILSGDAVCACPCLEIPINEVTPALLDEWETRLVALGYAVAREAGMFMVSHPSP